MKSGWRAKRGGGRDGKTPMAGRDGERRKRAGGSCGPPCPGLYLLGSGDIGRGRQVLFDAFRDDPFFSWLYGAERENGEAVPGLHGFTLRAGIRYGAAYAPSPGLEGIAIWLPPGRPHIDTWMALSSGILALRGSLPRGSGLRRSFLRRMMAYSDYSERLHDRIAPGPHWYLLAIGTRSGYRGKGYGAMLLRPMLERFDREGLPCYLETHNEANVSLYAHFGFAVAEQGTLPHSSQKHWAMLREPATRS